MFKITGMCYHAWPPGIKTYLLVTRAWFCNIPGPELDYGTVIFWR